ncbi:helix-turn-helix domain-containing protein [Corynebacterium sp. UMB6689]|uniref:helix-turn-helix domain-containing protein n=1 Tax=Corynebacterium sp. UMB6689 TaxID=3046341 RepID=UPI00254ED2F3|nr:helix-turn-helix domain-containing protein [Corynebacterium sp. UMB6689]MDK6814686.1 helix-turn-helix domain-containing protein [Corynebacterium sp. UMB6689]
MNAVTLINDRVMIDDAMVENLQSLPSLGAATFRVTDAEGRVVSLPLDVQRLISQVLTSVAQRGEITISRVPEELTSTVAAEILGVSRPTLMKWAKEGAIATHKRGTHARFKRDDVLKLKQQRAEERAQAFSEWREFEKENERFFSEP